MSWGQALHHRDRQAEVMDQPGLDPADHQRALHGLRRINAISRSSAGVFSSLLALPALEDHAPLSVLELACGGGDTAIDLERMASRRGVQLTIRACDLNPEAIRIARSNALQRASAVEFFVADALEDPGPERVDVVYCTLFAHHLDDGDVVKLLRVMAARARRLVVVDDLIRSRLGYALAWSGTRLLSRSWVVHTDGPLSVRAAFTPAELRRLAEQAGLSTARLVRFWPERQRLIWSPSA
jgi:2-polyprenyl-3-methyl-5-hydroxy-6-metoxy-1,4-benzoquinol methylase